MSSKLTTPSYHNRYDSVVISNDGVAKRNDGVAKSDDGVAFSNDGVAENIEFFAIYINIKQKRLPLLTVFF